MKSWDPPKPTDQGFYFFRPLLAFDLGIVNNEVSWLEELLYAAGFEVDDYL